MNEELFNILSQIECPHCLTPYIPFHFEKTPLHILNIYINNEIIAGYHNVCSYLGQCSNWVSTIELLKENILFITDSFSKISEDVKYVPKHKLNKVLYEKFRTYSLTKIRKTYQEKNFIHNYSIYLNKDHIRDYSAYTIKEIKSEMMDAYNRFVLKK